MTSFLENFLSGEKTPEEKSLQAQQEAEKKHDVLTVEGFEMNEDEGCDDDLAEYSSSPCGACCGGGCRS